VRPCRVPPGTAVAGPDSALTAFLTASETARRSNVSPAPPIIGLRREREVLTVALDTGRHVVIEGPARHR